MKQLTVLAAIFLCLTLTADITFAVYMAADNNMFSAYCINLDQMRIGSSTTEHVKIHVFADTPMESYRFFIHDSLIDTVSISSNVNSGDPKIISDFFSDVFSKYPDDMKIAVIWDHGNGWYNFKNEKSILYDNNPDDFISITENELNSIFEDIMKRTSKKTNIVVFDACGMQTLEVAYELTSSVDYIVASEDSVPYLGMPYDEILNTIDGVSDPVEVCKSICEEYYSLYDSLNENPVISAIKTTELQSDIKGMAFQDRSAFSDIDSINVSVYLEKSLICNKTFNEKYKGAKLFYPAYFPLLNELYPDYIKLKLDEEFDIVKQEFIWHDVKDTFKPLPVTDCSIISTGNENYRFVFNESYDFSNITEYRVHYSNDYYLNEEKFDSIPSYISGILSLSEFQPYSKPFSIYAKSLYITVDLSEDDNLIEFSARGVFAEHSLTVRNNGKVIYSNNRYIPQWKTIILSAEKGSAVIEFNSESASSSDYMYMDDLRIYGMKTKNTTMLHDTTGTVHKMMSGTNVIYITSADEYLNVSDIGGIFYFYAEDSVKAVIYPNPAKNSISLKTEYKGEYKFNLYTSSGSLVMSVEGLSTGEDINIDLKSLNLRQGIYFYAFTINSNTSRGKLSIVK